MVSRLQLSEGVIRVAIFIGYLLIVGRAKDVRRTFQYHGAEHMSIHTLEAGEPLTAESARTHPTAHPRCGTEFLVVVLIVSILAFAVVGSLPPLAGPAVARDPHPDHRRRQLRAPSARRAPPRPRHRALVVVPGHLGPDDHHATAFGRHDRSRDRFARTGAGGNGADHPGRQRAPSTRPLSPEKDLGWREPAARPGEPGPEEPTRD